MKFVSVVFRIRRQYYDQIVSGAKKVELRAGSPHWDKVVKRLSDQTRPVALPVAVFVCGKDIHRKAIASVSKTPISNLEAVLGRPPSDQGVKDLGLDRYDHFYEFHLSSNPL